MVPIRTVIGRLPSFISDRAGILNVRGLRSKSPPVAKGLKYKRRFEG